jgi:hypothetical protein
MMGGCGKPGREDSRLEGGRGPASGRCFSMILEKYTLSEKALVALNDGRELRQNGTTVRDASVSSVVVLGLPKATSLVQGLLFVFVV